MSSNAKKCDVAVHQVSRTILNLDFAAEDPQAEHLVRVRDLRRALVEMYNRGQKDGLS